MTRLVAVYGGLLRADLQVASTYRSQLVLGALGWVVPVAFMALWPGAASGGAVAGITPAELTTYFAVLLVTTSLQLSRPLSFGLAPLVHSGELSALLLRPVHPVHGLVSEALAKSAYGLPPLVVVTPVLVVALDGAVTDEVEQWALAAAIGLLGAVAGAYLGAMMGSLALWLTRSEGLSGLLFGAEWVLGGLVAPVALLPGPLPELLRHQPLWFAIGAPGEAVSGISALSAWSLAEAAGWVAALHVAFAVVWRRGLARYEAVGT